MMIFDRVGGGVGGGGRGSRLGAVRDLTGAPRARWGRGTWHKMVGVGDRGTGVGVGVGYQTSVEFQTWVKFQTWVEFQTWDGVPDMGGVPDMEWGSRNGVGYQTQVGFQTLDDGVPDRWWGTRQGWVKKGYLSFSEFSNVRFNLTLRGFNLISRKIISFTSCGNLTSHKSGILHSLIFCSFIEITLCSKGN